MDRYELCMMTTRNGTKLSKTDIDDIVLMINSGKSTTDVRKKYNIGHVRLMNILKVFNCKTKMYIIKNKLELIENEVSSVNDDFINIIERQTEELSRHAKSIKINNYLDD